ncbi:Gamma-glutamyltranspeptidase 1 [Grifola frondosa]|uniref:Glutathione hydrolase n=1 Tax=Grifola frondosa TaxID=5627 RepID=A0A1C7LZE6_GRIFR|nr:Gamma-glutamyltranspeptidase 1 [Grifola frondosa]
MLKHGGQLPLVYSRRREDHHKSVWKIILLAFGAFTVFQVCRDAANHWGAWKTCDHGSILKRTPSGTLNPAYIIEAAQGAVASENEICSQLGVDVLKEGGNAVDAIVSTTLCIGVVNMFSSGIGGGGFMTVRIPPSSEGASSEVYTIDFREVAPALSNTTMYVNDPEASRWGGLAVGVPGELRGLEEAHRRWGTLPWNKLVQPAMELASGWKVGKELARRIQGPLANAIVEKIRMTGGILSLEDLENYQVIVKPALQGSYRRRKVYTPHAPTSGPVLLHMLNLVEHYDDFVKEGRTVLNTHRYVEASKFGFAARTKIGDPAFHDESERIHEIPTKAFSDLIFPNMTDDRTHPPEYYNPVYDVPIDHGTSHSSIVDRNGMAVALTTTVNLVFGSLVMDPVTGIILNDEMDDFSTPGTPNAFGLYPSPCKSNHNYPEPGKRPLSSTTPTIIEHEDGSFYLAIGGSGGSRIFGSVFQVILNMDWGMDVSAAIEYGRLHDQLFPQMMDADDVYAPAVLNALREKGHNITVSDTNRVAAVVQVVAKVNDTIYASSDSRKNGIAAGY